MSRLLKIVRGPNAGAEIALVEGVAVTLGKSDECDIVLADESLPAEPLTIETSEDGTVTVGGEKLEPLHVKTVGETAFAVGPTDAKWGPLVEEAPASSGPEPSAPPEGAEAGAAPANPPAPEEKKARKRGGCAVGCFAMILLLLLLGAAAWMFRDTLRPHAEKLYARFGGGRGGETAAVPSESIEEFAQRNGLYVSTDENGVVALSGDFKTRSARLAAAAGAYAIAPGAALDFCDDESLRGAIEDTLFTVGGNALKVAAATNRFAVLTGAAPSAAGLRKALEALSADIPKLRGVDCAAVRLGGPGSDGKPPSAEDAQAQSAQAKKAAPKPSGRLAALPPVCGILQKPYPCLVMRNGARILEGAAIGGSTILKIEPDTVTLTNATGRFEWKP